MSGYDIDLDRTKLDPLNIMLDNIAEGSTVLEFGCANGRMTKYMSETLKCSVDIVEYDKDLFNIAIQYAETGLCGDISDFSWTKEFVGKKYDYIIFADVLEHLRNPQEVLCACKAFLNDNGLIWISVPNISHNDIIINLIEDEFEYSETGLLDETHIHFFTKKTAKKMFTEAGYFVAYEDGIFVRSFCSEQLLPSKPEWKWYYDELLKRDNGNLYQCVFALALNEEISLEQKNNSCWNQQKDIYERRVYFDCGEGFEEALISYENSNNKNLFILIDIPEKTQMVWVCPAFRKRFIIRKLKIEVDGTAVDYCNIRAERHGDDYYFQSLEGDIYIDAVKDCKKLVITGEIILDVEFERERYIEKLDSIKKREESLIIAIANKDKQLDEKDKQLDEKDTQLQKKNETEQKLLVTLAEKDKHIGEQLEEKEKMSALLEQKQHCIDELDAEKQRLTEMIEKIENTKWWRIRTFLKSIQKGFLRKS